MLTRWTERVPPLRGDLTTLREVAASDVYPLFTLLSDPAVTAYMAPPPPTLAKFAGFVDGRGVVLSEKSRVFSLFPLFSPVQIQQKTKHRPPCPSPRKESSPCLVDRVLEA